MGFETKPVPSSDYRSRATTRLVGSLWGLASVVELMWRPHRSPKDQLTRVLRDLDELDDAVTELRRARLRQLSAARRQRVES